MGRGAYALERVAVYLRTAASTWWWTGVTAMAAGAAMPGLAGRRVGLYAAAALLPVAAVVAFLARRGRYTGLLAARSAAGRWVVLRDRAVTAREWRRAHRWWLVPAFVVAVGSSAVLPAAGGGLLAGVGAGLWAKSVWLGRWERRHEALLWVRPEWAAGRSPVRRQVRGWMTTGPLAGDAAPGGAPRPRASRARAAA